MAEASRQTMGWRFATMQDREAIVGDGRRRRRARSLRLTRPSSHPARPRSAGRTARACSARSTRRVFSSESLLAAEDRLLERAAQRRRADGAAGDRSRTDHAQARRGQGPDARRRPSRRPDPIAVSGRMLDVLVGPAGAGKTTAMNALRRAWEAEHGPGSVVGLAPSAVAAQVLADDLGIQTENTAKWWQNHLARHHVRGKGQLVIIDEASLAGTALPRPHHHLGRRPGRRCCWSGDYAQLQSVDAGGAFSLLVHDRDDAPELVDVHRFTHAWEKTASLAAAPRPHRRDRHLPRPRPHHRRRDRGDDRRRLHRLARDTLAGRAVVLVAETRTSPSALNPRAG
jgi:ATP-dependent exoDNAse (exonuclease V) alpha subunit